MGLNIDMAKAAARTGAVKGLSTAAEHVLQVSRTRVPHQEGTLERSGGTSVDAGSLTAAVKYDTPYAVVQHEDQSLAHDSGRSAKYLESAVTGERATAAELVATAIRGALGGG